VSPPFEKGQTFTQIEQPMVFEKFLKKSNRVRIRKVLPIKRVCSSMEQNKVIINKI